MTKTLRALAIAAALLAVPAFAQAQATLGPTVAYHDDADFGVGVALGLPLSGLDEQIEFLGDFLIFFPDTPGLDFFEINGNLTYDFPIEDADVLPFALAGLNIARFSGDMFSNTEMGLNVGGGIKFDAGSLRPTVGLRLELEGGEGFVFFGTVPFTMGG
ncbi:MAG: hypothetical protein U5R14_14990 [Gemmatimonadota bacterium]|nr:hypothetical protein [Gemmatimonadota bacterium]